MKRIHANLRWIRFLVFFLLIIEGDYSGYPVPTTPIFAFFYAQIISGMPCINELIAFALAAPILFKFATGGTSDYTDSKIFKAMVIVGLSVIVASVTSTVYGLLTGGVFRIAAWQVRSFPLFLCWSVVAFRACSNITECSKFLNLFVTGVLIKSVYNIIILHTYYHGSLGGKEAGEEYISSHIGSFYMGIGVLILVAKLLFQSRGIQRLWLTAGILLIAYPWVANDRRVSFIGVAFALIFSMSFLYRFVSKKHIKFIIIGVLAGAIFVGATWNNEGHSVRSLFVKDPTEAIDYRDIENYNLYRAVAEFAVIGRGYGYPFHQYMQLADIFSNREALAWIPHNNILLIWAFGGAAGLATFGLMMMFGIAVMVRLFRSSSSLEVRVFSFIGFATMVQWTMYFWADMALAWGHAFIVPGVLTGFAVKLLAIDERKKIIGSKALAPSSTLNRMLVHG